MVTTPVGDISVPPADAPILLLISWSSLRDTAPLDAFTAFSISAVLQGFPFSSVAFLYLTPAEPVPDILIVP